MANRYGPMDQPARRASSALDPLGLLPFRRRINAENGKILEFSRIESCLVEWFWPVREDGARVPPSDLVNHRATHCFRGPSCLCSALDPDPNAFTEAAIFRARSGRLSGQWVAACANSVCHYFYVIERLYARQGLPIKRYPLRELGDVPPPPVTRGMDAPLLSLPSSAAPSPAPSSGSSTKENRAPKRSAAALNDDNDGSGASTSGRSSLARTSSGDSIFSTSSGSAASTSSGARAAQRRRIDLSGAFVATSASSSSRSTASTDTVASTPSGRLRLVRRNRRVPTPFIQLLKLDEFVDGGLSDREFGELFVQCQVCRRWMTERVYRSFHANFCVIDLTDEAEEREVIDLTHLD
ncbi:hypothetical protein FA95DRAFT_1609463 [Auriscalpium vulgare]|uniref:Uncharacterized protein n=1 Tax=Auriscalpium vulgare TaxID=40419 RepID=A0ACB8RGN4_9AGAM|nr:hypothetical protein FA95DRAFT_1609463 [Auriscalpium vulgare]